MSETRSYTVAGMTCQHCVQSVTQEVGRVPGVTAVDIDLPTGRVDVTSDVPLDDASIAAAVDEAGYEVTS
jgi:copper chaperone